MKLKIAFTTLLPLLTAFLFGPVLSKSQEQSRVKISGELKQWHKITLDLTGPFANETDSKPNPFMDYKMTVTFTHESGKPSYKVPAYFAADGNAAQTSADKGNIWRAHLSPDRVGRWNYSISFLRGEKVAVDACPDPQKVVSCDGLEGTFEIVKSDKKGVDLRSKGRLSYVGKRYLQFQGNGEYFLKAGTDAPETLLAYADFDNTIALKAKVPLKTYTKHLADFEPENPTWKNGKGKGLIGAINYLSSKGINSFSFLTYNAGGDGDDVWPYVQRDDKFHFDCSKLDQWQIVFDYAQEIGMHLHFKLQENESDDHRDGAARKPKEIKEALDQGDTGPERKVYLRELIARYAHELALNWNMGEENTQSYQEQIAMIDFVKATDPYQHHRVIHTFPEQQDRVYTPLLGNKSNLTGASLQNLFNVVHQRTLKWLKAADSAGKEWVVANDEQNPASTGVPQDIGYDGTDGLAIEKNMRFDLNDIRKYTLWGNLMAGGAGVEYYFGYKLPENDLIAEDFRSRNKSWEYASTAIRFFKDQKIPFWEMENANEIIENPKNTNKKYCLAKAGEIYVVYLPEGGNSNLDLKNENGTFSVKWFDPVNGGRLKNGEVKLLKGGRLVNTGYPPEKIDQDWIVVLRKK